MWATQTNNSSITWTHTNDNMSRWMQTFQCALLLTDFKRMHTWWTPRPDAEACREWNGNQTQYCIISSRFKNRDRHEACKHTKLIIPPFLFLALPHTRIYASSVAPSHTHGNTHLPNESPSQVLSIISIPWISRDCRAQLHDMRVSGVKWNAHSKCHFIFKA